MRNVIIINKNIGETPLECLERIRIQEGISSDVPMTYAGRLDPLAEGQMIILVGDECKNKEKYLDYDKEYEVEILFGFSTDSYDVLGLVDDYEIKQINEININKYLGKFEQKYPRYSSKIIAMKEVPDEMPTKEVEIYSIENFGTREIKGSDLVNEILAKINLVKGDFRQNEITARWSSISKDIGDSYFTILKLRVRCSSGTYMRTLAHNMGIDHGVPALALSIRRNSIIIDKLPQ